MRPGAIVVVVLITLFGSFGLLFLSGSVPENAVFDLLIPRPQGVPQTARASWEIKGGVSWHSCRSAQMGSDHARWFGGGRLDAVWVTPGAPCPAYDATGLMIENLDSNYESIFLIGGNDRQTCGNRVHRLPQHQASELAAGADERAFGTEAKRAFSKLARAVANGLVLDGPDGAFDWCSVKAPQASKVG